jgi:hypothetical protein
VPEMPLFGRGFLLAFSANGRLSEYPAFSLHRGDRS